MLKECKDFNLEGYTGDFYLCVREKLEKGEDCLSAISICEILYG